MLTESDIQKMADIIAERFQPEKIILFGSYANGTATDDSDVDLIVVVDTNEDLSDKTADIRMALRHFGVPKDVLVRAPEMYDSECEIYWTVFSQALQHGKTLYAKAS